MLEHLRPEVSAFRNTGITGVPGNAALAAAMERVWEVPISLSEASGTSSTDVDQPEGDEDFIDNPTDEEMLISCTPDRTSREEETHRQPSESWSPRLACCERTPSRTQTSMVRTCLSTPSCFLHRLRLPKNDFCRTGATEEFSKLTSQCGWRVCWKARALRNML